MLGKLLKYDLKFGVRPFLVMGGGMIFASILLGLFDFDTISGLGLMFLFPIIIVTIFIACVALVYQNFNRNLLSNEGYFMMSLPVKRYKFIISKLMTSIIWFNFMILAGVISGIFLVDRDFMRIFNFSIPFFVSVLTDLLLGANLFAVNAILALYLLAVMSNVSIGGKKIGWSLGVASLVAFLVIEVMFIIHVANRIFNGLNLWVVMYEREGGGNSLSFYLHDSDLWRVLFLERDQMPYMISSIEIAPTLSIILFSVIAFFIIEYCLRKQVDLQ